MKIVIDIPNEKYKRLPYIDQFSLREYIENGTPLPKGHGRIIDENKITKCEQVGLIIKNENIIRCLVTDAPTIIEADK